MGECHSDGQTLSTNSTNGLGSGDGITNWMVHFAGSQQRFP